MASIDAVKEKNKAIYLRDEKNITAVAAPTQAMQEGGTEYRLILAVVCGIVGFY
jgi:hypothetical protein